LVEVEDLKIHSRVENEEIIGGIGVGAFVIYETLIIDYPYIFNTY